MNEPAQGGTSGTSDSAKWSLTCTSCDHIMEQPILLACLHSCCEHCSQQRKSGDVICCSRCSEETSFCKVFKNDLLHDLIREVHASRGEAKCDFCDKSEATEHPASAYCSQCNKFLCDTCDVQHRKFLPSHDAKRISRTSVGKFMTRSCPCQDHPDAICSYFCWSCEKPQCRACALACQTAGHDAKSIETCTRTMKNELMVSRERLASKAQALHAIESLGLEASESRRALKSILLRNKKSLLEAIDRVFDEANEGLRELCDDVDLSASKSISLASELQKKAEDALNYSELLGNRDDVRYLAQQRRLVIDRLEVLDRNVTSLIADAELPRVHISSSESFALLESIRDWIGIPTLRAAEEPQSGFCKFSRIEEYTWSVNHLSCRDIALTADGNVLLALGHRGLKEFNDKSRELSHWRPQNNLSLAAEEVRTVEALNGDLVAVGLKLLGCVTILRRNTVDSKRWNEARRITDGLRGVPYSMSASTDLLLVAEGRLDEIRTPRPGRELILISLSRWKRESRLTSDYEVSSVAVSSEHVFTASDGKFCSATSAVATFVVEAFRYANDQDATNWSTVWRYEHNGKVGDMCLHSEMLSTRLLLVGEDGRVAILAADSGIKQSVMFQDEESNQSAVRLATMTHPIPQLALLFRDGAVRVYAPQLPAAPCQRSATSSALSRNS